MKLGFPRFFRIAAAAVLLGMYATSNFASAMSNDWQFLAEKATLLLMQGQRDRGLEVAREALDVAENSPVKNQQNIALSLFLLASTYREVAQYDQALAHYRRLLPIIEPLFGPEHRDTVQVLDAMVLCYMHRPFDKALPLLQRILATREKALGPEHLK